MNRNLLLVLGLTFISCEVDTIIETYESEWQADLVGVLPSIRPGRYSGLNAIEDRSVLVLREVLNNDFTSELAVIEVSQSADVLNTSGPINNGQNIDILQSTWFSSTLKLHGQSVENPRYKALFLLIRT